jgi:hypothetical protein
MRKVQLEARNGCQLSRAAVEDPKGSFTVAIAEAGCTEEEGAGDGKSVDASDEETATTRDATFS